MRATQSLLLPVTFALISSACGGGTHGGTTPRSGQLDRARFNQLALRLDLPLFWANDADGDGAPDPDEVRGLAFYPTSPTWVEGGAFTPAFDEALAQITREHAAPMPRDARRALVITELDHAAPTLVETDLSTLPEAHRRFASHMVRVAALMDRLYARQVGMDTMQARLDASDAASASLFRRNWGPACRGSTTEAEAGCSAIAGAPHQTVDAYPAALQGTDGSFCATLEARPDAQALLDHFSVVREREGTLVAVPYHEAYAELMQPIAVELRAAADAMTDPNEAALVTYLRAAATSFETNEWAPADEAWSTMNARNRQVYSTFSSGVRNFESGGKEGSKTYLATARYSIDQTSSVYFRAASGYRPGGPNPPALDADGSVVPGAPKSFEVLPPKRLPLSPLVKVGAERKAEFMRSMVSLSQSRFSFWATATSLRKVFCAVMSAASI